MPTVELELSSHRDLEREAARPRHVQLEPTSDLAYHERNIKTQAERARRRRRRTVPWGNVSAAMGFDQYHEPPEELSQETRTLARIFASLTEEAEAINWYEQRLSIEEDAEARSIIEDARHEEYKHFSMDLEFLFRRRPEWRAIAQGVLFRSGEITANADAAEEASEGGGDASETGSSDDGSLGIGPDAANRARR